MPVQGIKPGAIGEAFPAFAASVERQDGVAAFNEDTVMNLATRQAHAIEIEGELAALALSRRLEDGSLESELAVHPERRNRGLGGQLLTALVKYALDEDAPGEQALGEHARGSGNAGSGDGGSGDAGSGNGALQLWAHGDLPAARALADAHGFERVRTLYQLELPLVDVIPEPTLKAAERIRPFDRERDGERWVALNAAIFATHPEQGALRLADLDARIAQDWFRAEDFLILESSGGEMLGYNWLKVTGEEGEIYVIGVAANAAGHGYGTALMRAGLRRMRDRGVRVAVLYVDGENERAVDLYRRLGFTDRAVDVQYRREGLDRLDQREGLDRLDQREGLGQREGLDGLDQRKGLDGLGRREGLGRRGGLEG